MVVDLVRSSRRGGVASSEISGGGTGTGGSGRRLLERRWLVELPGVRQSLPPRHESDRQACEENPRQQRPWTAAH